MNSETPQFFNQAYGSTCTDLNLGAITTTGAGAVDWRQYLANGTVGSSIPHAGNALQSYYVPSSAISFQQPTQNTMTKRIVRVYLADTDEDVPLEKSLLYSSEEKLTDLNDQELFFEIPIQQLLKDHNLYRATLVDKAQTNKLGKEVHLEPVKIRDLKMTVVTVASF